MTKQKLLKNPGFFLIVLCNYCTYSLEMNKVVKIPTLQSTSAMSKISIFYEEATSYIQKRQININKILIRVVARPKQFES